MITSLLKHTAFNKTVIIQIVEVISADIVLNVVDSYAVSVMANHKGVKHSVGVFHVHCVLREEITVEHMVGTLVNSLKEIICIEAIV